MTQTLTTETIKLWRINAEITLGETDELDPENNAAKAILDLTAELLRYREAAENPSCWEIAGQLFTTKEEALKPGYRGTPEPLYDGPVLTDDREAQPVGYIAEVCGNRVGVLRGLPLPDVGSLIYTAPPAPAVPRVTEIPEACRGAMLNHSGDSANMVNANPVMPKELVEEPGTWKTPDVVFGWNECRAAMLAQPVSQVGNWVACSERMPVEGDTVLVCQEGGIVYCAEMEGGVLYPDEFPRVPTQGKEITHWMPLPAAPEGGND